MSRVTRRSLLAGGLALGAGPTAVTDAQSRNGRKRVFVLVHGAWHGGWCWERLTERLITRGHRVYAPALSGVGERSHLAAHGINLETHIADIVGELRWKDLTHIVLLGHSYGGMVITGVAERELPRIHAIVYLDAFLPKSGQSVNDMVGFVSGNGADPVPPLYTPEMMSVNSADREWVRSKLTPQPAATFSQKLDHSRAYDRVSVKVYIRPIDFPSAFSDAVCDPLRKDPTWQVHDMRGCGHDVMIDKPEELAQFLEKIA